MPLWKSCGVSKPSIEPGNVYAGACENLKESVDQKKIPYPAATSPSPPNVKEFKITWYFSAHGFS